MRVVLLEVVRQFQQTLVNLQPIIFLQQLESLCWHRNGKEFLSSHADGSYVQWVVDKGNQPEEEQTPYGQY